MGGDGCGEGRLSGRREEIVARLQTEISKALGGADVKSRLDGVGREPFKSSADQFAELIRVICLSGQDC